MNESFFYLNHIYPQQLVENMDPIAMSKSALDVLAWYKGQLDKSKASYENAKQLLRFLL
jgi:hypothetical protein